VTDFFRFPHTPHLAWLGDSKPRDDKVFSTEELRDFLSGPIRVEEKVDGANLGFSVTDDGELKAQNRGSHIDLDAPTGQWRPLKRWLAPRRQALVDALYPNLLLFGEWCYAVHNLHYTDLPDWFLAFDVYDRDAGVFWSTRRRDPLLEELQIGAVPYLGDGVFTVASLERLSISSSLYDGPAEGVYLRKENEERLLARGKLVRTEFTQQIGEHWSNRGLTSNSLASRSTNLGF
jgi:ATP-dependent RNA circularization protein (DNA/RNA ligase family)